MRPYARWVNPAVRLEEAVALLGRFPALAGVDLVVDPGEVVLLQGPNGAGKSTLLRLCSGLMTLEAGAGQVLGHNLADDRRALRPRVGLLAHQTALYGELTVRENVEFWARAVHVSPSEVPAALDRLGLPTRLHDVPVRGLSAGQRRRTALATLVVRRPELWLLDEPHAALDQAGRDVVDTLIGQAVDSGATVLVASHELDRVRSLSERVVTIAGGVVVEDTRPSVARQGSAGGS